MTTSRLKMAYAAGLAAVVALAGCGDGGTQAGGPSTAVEGRTSTAVTSPATPTTPTAPVDPVLARIPAAARPETMKGAEAFARFYIGQVNQAWSGPDAAAVEGLFSVACKGCVAFSESAQDMEVEGRHHGGDTLTVTEVSIISFLDSTSEVRLAVTQNAVPVLDKKGEPIRTSSADQGSFVLTLKFKDHWTVERLQAVKQ